MPTVAQVLSEARADRPPRYYLGTAGVASGGTVPVVLDVGGAQISARTLTNAPPSGARVLILLTPSIGAYVIGVLL